MCTPQSEAEATRAFVQREPGEPLPAHLKRVIPRIQTKRAQAYNRLEAALKTSRGDTSAVPPRAATPARKVDYAAVCAHVTEDLKLCSEGVLELRRVLSREGEAREQVAWLDRLQALEERKLVATVSKHVLVRSGDLADDNVRERVKRFGRELCEIDEGINDILQEMREYFLEFEGE